MFKLNNTHRTHYGELPQPNPLRWRIMHRDKNLMSSQSGLIKCKDFFNDIVAWKKANMQFTMYDFKNNIKFNRYGVYFHLTQLHDREQFFANLDIMNERITADMGTKVSYYPASRSKTSAFVHIPNPLWESTYYISLVTMLIRLCNYAYKYNTWDDFFNEDAPLNTVDKAFTKEAKELTKVTGFKLPENVSNLWYCARFNVNSKTTPKPSSAVVHNNGCSDWARALKEIV